MGIFADFWFVVDIRAGRWFLVARPLHSTVFSQFTALLYQPEFQRCAETFPMPRSSRSFSA